MLGRQIKSKGDLPPADPSVTEQDDACPSHQARLLGGPAHQRFQRLPLFDAQTDLDELTHAPPNREAQALIPDGRRCTSQFDETIFLKNATLVRSAHGVISFEKPNKIDWSYDDPAGNKEMFDGTQIRLYVAARHELYVREPDKAYATTLCFLKNGAALSQRFRLRVTTEAGFPGYLVIGTPIPGGEDYLTVVLYVDAASDQIRRVVTVDSEGNRDRIDFKHVQLNPSLRPNQFEFIPPPDTIVVKK